MVTVKAPILRPSGRFPHFIEVHDILLRRIGNNLPGLSFWSTR